MSNEDFVVGADRRQSLFLPEILDEYVSEDNEVRVIDAFVDILDLKELGFMYAERYGVTFTPVGRPPFDPRDLLKLYIWGYLNTVRTSRKLHKECERNLEVIWLMKKLIPDDRTISDFRKNNVECIKPVFKKFVCFLRDIDLVEGKICSVDGSKYKASNSRKRNFTEEKLADWLKDVDERIKRYFDEMEENDKKIASGEDSAEEDRDLIVKRNAHLTEKLKKAKKKKKNLESIQKKLEKLKKETDQTQISLTDPDCRLMSDNGKAEVAYNPQISIDSKEHMAVEYDVTNQHNDENQLAPMGKKTKETLDVDEISMIGDRGYFNGHQIKECTDNGITPYVPEPAWKPRKAAGGVPMPDFLEDKFLYSKEKDVYVCPAENELNFHYTSKIRGYNMRYYSTNACNNGCPFRSMCTNRREGRQIRRWEDEELLEDMRKRVKYEQPAMSDLRRNLSEHPTGTIKRALNQGYFLLRGLKKVNGEFGFTVLAYDIRRALNILGTGGLMDALAAWVTINASIN